MQMCGGDFSCWNGVAATFTAAADLLVLDALHQGDVSFMKGFVNEAAVAAAVVSVIAVAVVDDLSFWPVFDFEKWSMDGNSKNKSARKNNCNRKQKAF